MKRVAPGAHLSTPWLCGREAQFLSYLMDNTAVILMRQRVDRSPILTWELWLVSFGTDIALVTT